MRDTQAAARARILVVDDDPVFRVYFAGILEDMGHEALEAADGEEGLRRFRESAPDMVLLDLRMPRLDGLAVLDAMAAEAPGTPVVVVSATTEIRNAVGALRRGAWDYVVKPIQDPDLLRHVLDKALAHARVLRENWRYHERLAEEVRVKTLELTEANERLAQEKAQVEGMNVTLRNVLGAVEREKRAIVEELGADIESRVLPVAERMARESSPELRASFLAVLRDELSRLCGEGGGPVPALFGLTPTELEVCRYLELGRGSKEIADLLNCSMETVQTHRKNIRAKLGIKGEKVNLSAFLRTRTLAR
ncbi:response regulator [Desulfovibrio aminophilus]|nr:response regulator [Desulfovibrio aminophilus]MCM0755740.1 response regulator [Desulfovibrio aminophilus]